MNTAQKIFSIILSPQKVALWICALLMLTVIAIPNVFAASQPGPMTISSPAPLGDNYLYDLTTTATVATTGSTDTSGISRYRLCYSQNSTGAWRGCEIWGPLTDNLSDLDVVISGTQLPSSGTMKWYYWYPYPIGSGPVSAASYINRVSLDSTDPSVSANNASSSWFSSRTTTLSASDNESGVVQARYSWDTNHIGFSTCTAGGTIFADGATINVPAGSHRLYLCARDANSNVDTWDSGAGMYNVDNTAPTKDSMSLSTSLWKADGSTTYNITMKATDSETGLSSGSARFLALINYQGSNTANRRGYFSWQYGSYTWSGDQVPCTGGGYASKHPSSYNPSTVTLVECTTSVLGNQRTVTLTVRPEATFGDFDSMNDISFNVRDSLSNATGWSNYDFNFTSDGTAPTQDSLTVSNNAWIPNGANKYDIVLTATDTVSGMNAGSSEMRALVNYQGSNSGNRRGYFSWRKNTYTFTDDQIPCDDVTGGKSEGATDGYASKSNNVNYHPDKITLTGCSTELVGDTRIVTFTVQPESSFGDFGYVNDISFWADDWAGNNTGWVNHDINFSSDTAAPVTSNFTAEALASEPLDSNSGSVILSWGAITELASGLNTSGKSRATISGTALSYDLTGTSADSVTFTGLEDNTTYTANLYLEDNAGFVKEYTSVFITKDRENDTSVDLTLTSQSTSLDASWTADSSYVGSESISAAFNHFDGVFVPSSESKWTQDYFISARSGNVRRYSADFTYIDQIPVDTYTGLTYAGNSGGDNIFYTQDWNGYEVDKWVVTDDGAIWTEDTGFVATVTGNRQCLGIATDGTYLYCNASGSAAGTTSGRSGRVDRYLIGATGLTYKGYFDVGSSYGEGLAYSNGYLYVGGNDDHTSGVGTKVRVYGVENWADGTGEWDETPYLTTTLTTSEVADIDLLIAYRGNYLYVVDYSVLTAHKYELLDRFELYRSATASGSYSKASGADIFHNSYSDTNASDTTAPGTPAGFGGDSLSDWTVGAAPTVTWVDATDSGNENFYYLKTRDSHENSSNEVIADWVFEKWTNGSGNPSDGWVENQGVNAVQSSDANSGNYSVALTGNGNIAGDPDDLYWRDVSAAATARYQGKKVRVIGYVKQGSANPATANIRIRTGVGNSVNLGNIITNNTWQKVEYTYTFPTSGVNQFRIDLEPDVNGTETTLFDDVEVHLIESDTFVSGLDGYATSWTQGATDITSTTKNVENGIQTSTGSGLSDGNNWYFNIRSVDNQGNWDASTDTISYGPFYVDVTAPSVSITGAPGSWQNTDATAGMNCADATSGCDNATKKFLTFTSDPGVCPDKDELYTINGPTFTVGSHVWVCAMMEDVGNNQGFSIPVEFQVDKTVPTCGTWSPVAGTWTNTSPQNFVLSGSTDTGGSAVNTAGGNCDVATHNSTCTVQIDDNAGNTTTCTSPNAQIDTINPVQDSLTISDNYWRTDGTATYDVVMTASDTTSGIVQMRALVNYQGSNSGNRRGYFGWNLGAHIWPGDQVTCTGNGGGFVSKDVSATYNPEAIIITACDSVLSGNQRTVTITLEPQSTFGDFGFVNDIAFWILDAATNGTGWVNYDLNFATDATDPTCGDWNPEDGSVPWTATVPQTFTLSNSVDNSGGSGINVAGGNCDVNTHNNSCTVQISDNVGNTTDCASPAAKIDVVDPVTSAAVTSGTAGDNGWYTSDVEVTITPSDSLSGISTTQYCIDTANSCNPANAYSTPLSISTEGTNYVRYSSTDAVGNTQATQSFMVKVDKTAPAVIASPSSQVVETPAAISVTLTPSDAGTSGLLSARYVVDGTASETVGTVFAGATPLSPISAVGLHSISYWAKDAAGNEMTGTFQWYAVLLPPVSCSFDSGNVALQRAGLLQAWLDACGATFATFMTDNGIANDATLTALNAADMDGLQTVYSVPNTTLVSDASLKANGILTGSLKEALEGYLCSPEMQFYDLQNEIIPDLNLDEKPFTIPPTLSCP